MKKPKTPRRSARPPPRRDETIDAWLAALPDAGRRAVLERLRRNIRAAAPDAVECFSYGMPAFRVSGRVVAGFQATAGGGSYYPFSGSTLDAVGDAIAGFGRTKSALHFTVDHPLPAGLVRKLLRARLAEAARSQGPLSRLDARCAARTAASFGGEPRHAP